MTSVPLLIVRPEPGNAATVAAAESLGLTAIAEPLFRIEPVAWTVPVAERFDAVVFGSANAIRCGGSNLAALTSLPAYAVGEATARAARDAGFTVAGVGARGLAQLVPRLAEDGRQRVLRLAGEEHVVLEAPSAMTVETIVVYAARPLPLSQTAVASLRQGAVVLLHSAAAAGHFAQLSDDARVDRNKLALACLGPRIATAAGGGWREVRAATRHDDAALLALAAEMCQSS